MARHRHLPNAPITEAVIDIRVRLTIALTDDILQTLRSAFLADFPTIEDQRSYEGFIHFEPEGVSQSGIDRGIVGLLCRSDERQEAVQLSSTGYAFSKLQPYTSWEEVLSSAQRFWARYIALVRAEMVTRLGVRYINQFEVPRHQSVERYVTNAPRLPENIDQAMMRNSLTRFLVRDERSDVSARVVQVMETGDAGTKVIIDTDAFRPDESRADTNFWPAFGDLRDMKNRVFFGSITDKAAEEFE